MGNYTIGPKIGLDGEADFRKQLNGINECLRTTDSEMKKVTSAFSDNAKSEEALRAKNDVLNKSIELQEKKLAEVRKALEYSKSEYGDNATQTQKWQRILNNTETDLNNLRSEVKKNEQAINDLGNAVDDVSDGMGAMQENIDEIAKSTKAAAFMEAADQLSAVGDKLSEISETASDVSVSYENANAKVRAYFNESDESAEQSAKIIKEIYAEGVGESLDYVSDAIITVKKNLKNLSETDLKNITMQSITLESLYGIDMNETLRGVNALVTQYGLSAQEALNYIVVGTQKGLDKTNELGDNLSEYAGKFEQAGYSASEYFQLLENGLNNGAYNLDKVNDAINEVTTRLADGTIEDALNLYDTKTNDVFNSWKAGKATQKDVIDSIVENIKNTTNEQEALNMAATAFGTMAEDGNLKFITSLTSVGDTFKNVSSAAENMFDQTSTSSQTAEANARKFEEALVPLGDKLTELKNEILTPLADEALEISDWFSQQPDFIQTFVIVLGGLIVLFTTLVPIIAALSVSISALNISMLPVIAIIAGIAAAITAVILIVKNWGNITDWFQTKVVTAFVNMGNSIKNKVNEIKTNIINGFNNAIDFIKSLPQQAVTWGKDFIQGLIDGIYSKIENIKNAVISVADTISSFLHFSVPDEGPLRDSPKWMPDMIDLMTQGIEDNEHKLKKAARSLATLLDEEFYYNANIRNVGYASSNITVHAPTYLDGVLIADNTQKVVTNQQASVSKGRGAA